MMVTNRAVPLLEHRMVGEVVALHVRGDLLSGPVQDRVDLDAAVLPIDAAQPRAMLGLLGAYTRHPALRVQARESPFASVRPC